MTAAEQIPQSEQPDERTDPPTLWAAREFTIDARSQRQQIIGRFRKDRRSMVALGVYLTLLLGALVGPLFYPHSYADLDLAHKSAPPGTPGHILGTQELGRDLLAMLMRVCSTRP